MVAPVKQEKVRDLEKKIGDLKAIFFADFQGIPVNDLRKIRVDLLKIHSSIEVVKNRLFKLAIKEKVQDYPGEVFTGNTAIILCHDDVVSTAKVLKDHSKSYEKFNIKGGFLDFRFLTREKVSELATLPPKPELVSRVLGMMNSPVRRLVTVLNSGINNLAVVLNQVAKQKEINN
ncbi:MAG TPA: 50S ribosomal protein L10 [Firmicutes bacterium]|nr:50S ribosomal protein L10 [Bacillota bacterium]